MAFAALNYALNAGGNAIWLVLLHDAGHNILDIPWWVWLLGGAALAVIAAIAAPELMIAFAPEMLEAVEAGEAASEAVAVAGEAAFDESMAAQGLEGVTAEEIDGALAVREGEFGEAVGNALREAMQVAQGAPQAWVEAFEQSMAQQAARAATAAAVVDGATALGVAGVVVGASQAPAVLGDIMSTGQASAAPTGVSSGASSGPVPGGGTPDAPASTSGPTHGDGVNAGDPG